jgi:hypothetical protein
MKKTIAVCLVALAACGSLAIADRPKARRYYEVSAYTRTGTKLFTDTTYGQVDYTADSVSFRNGRGLLRTAVNATVTIIEREHASK